jgi:hypothetical protein
MTPKSFLSWKQRHFSVTLAPTAASIRIGASVAVFESFQRLGAFAGPQFALYVQESSDG